MMIKIDETCWKRIVTFVDKGGFEQKNVQHGDDSERQYLRHGEVVATMLVRGANTGRPAYQNVWEFRARQELLDTVADIELPPDAFEMEEPDDV